MPARAPDCRTRSASCCLESEGRWPLDLPHWEHFFWDDADCADEDAENGLVEGGSGTGRMSNFPEAVSHDWLMPDGSRATGEMIDRLAERLRKALDDPSPAGSWP